MPLGIVLAGGRSSRMGGEDKAWLMLGGMSLAARVAARLKPQCTAVIASANRDAGRYAALDLAVVADDLPDRPGPIAGILAGLDWAARHRPELACAVSVATDTPFLPRDLVRRLGEAAGASGIACAASRGRRHPVIALWPVALRHDLRRLLVEEREARMWAVLDRLGAATVDWPTEPYDPFLNINTPADLAAASAILVAHPDA